MARIYIYKKKIKGFNLQIRNHIQIPNPIPRFTPPTIAICETCVCDGSDLDQRRQRHQRVSPRATGDGVNRVLFPQQSTNGKLAAVGIEKLRSVSYEQALEQITEPEND
nr:hypothetical protein Iba_chr11dCG10440 [Ipomoea batatas]